jgi:DNA invertase Pin-like site-specific DNA recombinase
MKKTLKRIAVYARVSRDKQETKNQLLQLRAFAARQGWRIVGEYVDHVTGKHSDREQFQQLFEAASRRQFDLVLFWSLDRFSREGVLRTLQHLERLNGWGVDWRSFTEQYLDSCGAFRDAVLSILASIAKQERIRISERTIAGLERAKREGKTLGRPWVEIDVKQARKLKARGHSFSQIAAALDVNRSTLVKRLYERRCA